MDISRRAAAYLGRYFGAFLLLVRWGAIWESEKDQWSYNDRNGYEHLHPPAEKSKHQQEKRAPGDGLKEGLTLYKAANLREHPGRGRRRVRERPGRRHYVGAGFRRVGQMHRILIG